MKEEDIKTLVQYRLEQTQNALNDAQNLLKSDGSVEGIINRSYYAMFYAVLALLQNMEKVPRKHSGVISLFDLEFYKRGIFPKQFSKDLHKAFELRQKSDYQDLMVINRETAEEVFSKAGAFVEAIREHIITQRTKWLLVEKNAG